MAQPMPPMGGGGMGMMGQAPGPGGRAHLYIGNLSPRVNEPILGEIFSVYGPVIGIKLIPDRNFQHGGLNYGFVEFQTVPAAENALNSLNGRKIFETEIKVNWAYQNTVAKEDLSQHFHVFVGDLSPEITDETLKKAFIAFGTLTDARVMWDMATGKSRGYGFLAFRDKPDAEQAITAMNGEWLGSRAIRVNWANQRVGGDVMAPGTGAAGGPVRISNLPPFLGPPGQGGPPVPPAPGQAAASDSSNMPPPQMPGQGLMPNGQHPPNQFGGSPFPGQPGPPHNQPPHFQHQQHPPQQPRFAPQKPLTYDVVVQQSPPSNSTVYVGNLVPHIQQSDLVPLFQGFGYISEVRVQADRGYAFIKLDTHQNAAMAIVNVNGSNVQGRPIKCAWGKDKLGSDTSIIANQANGVTSPPLDTENGGAGMDQFGGYTGWPYGGFPYGGQQAAAKPELSSAQASYYAQYYNYGGSPAVNGNGVSA